MLLTRPPLLLPCSEVFPSPNLLGVQEDVQLREQDFGNFQDIEGKKREKAERMRFGRFFYRFPNGESGADVYDRITNFQVKRGAIHRQTATKLKCVLQLSSLISI